MYGEYQGHPQFSTSKCSADGEIAGKVPSAMDLIKDYEQKCYNYA